MTKADIVNQISAETGLQKRDVTVAVEAFMDVIKNSLLEKKENVYLRGFGSFIVCAQQSLGQRGRRHQTESQREIEQMV